MDPFVGEIGKQHSQIWGASYRKPVARIKGGEEWILLCEGVLTRLPEGEAGSLKGADESNIRRGESPSGLLIHVQEKEKCEG